MKIESYPIEKTILAPVKLYKNDLKSIIELMLKGGYKIVKFSYDKYTFKYDEINEFIKESKKNVINNIIIEVFSEETREEVEIAIDIDNYGASIISNNDTIINEGLVSKIYNYLETKKGLSIFEIFGISFFIFVLISCSILIFNTFFWNSSLFEIFPYISGGVLILFLILFSFNDPLFYKINPSSIILKKSKSSNSILEKYKNETIFALIINLISMAIIKVIYGFIQFILKIIS